MLSSCPAPIQPPSSLLASQPPLIVPTCHQTSVPSHPVPPDPGGTTDKYHNQGKAAWEPGEMTH